MGLINENWFPWPDNTPCPIDRSFGVEVKFTDGARFARAADVMLKPPENALDVQVGGNHYKDCKIQPVEYIHGNGLGYFEGNIVKYVTRWRAKGGIEDLRKVIHYTQLLIELELRESATKDTVQS